MRIVVQSHSSAPFNFGGAELALVELLDEWRVLDSNALFLVIAPHPEGNLRPEMERRGIDFRTVDFDPLVGEFPDAQAPLSFTENLRAVSAIAATRHIIREFDADLVVTNTIVAPWAAIAAKAEQVPHIWFAHEYGSLEHGLSFRLGREDTFTDIGMLSDLVVANSAELLEHLSEWIPRERLRVIHPSLAPQRVRELAGESALVPQAEGSGLTVVIAGRIAEPKGQMVLIEALAILRAEGRDVRARIIGIFSGGYEKAFRDRLKRLGVADQVEFLGDLSNPFPAVRGADVGLSLSFNESFGRVSLEYMALGLPVVVTRTGIARSLVRDGVDGYVIEPGSAEALAEALRRLADDTDARRAMGKAALEQASVIHEMHPVEKTVSEIRALVGAMEKDVWMPRSLGVLFESPELLALNETEIDNARVSITTTMSWRLGSALLAPVRKVRALTSRATSRR
ncbi:glycosyltransferase family 4 protein [Salinibacterium sp. M195]|uniref:glycosyltransferase family 4 protein n=1 Tax=Salinibacterium sp. M195 TaxID=2583374 RepID=UPI001C62E1AB|nr:glycosyltransferase family 4 protein [Salinibacterium sp. M195]QYH34850.1 glycosyltransferase family 4 protein [Salinibacterium sp. M195]